jgi:phosphatidate cytidylyltransferase
MKRILTASIAIPLVLVITVFSPDWLFAAVTGVVSAAAAEEFFSLAATKGLGRPGRWFLAAAGAVTFAFVGGAAWVLTAMVASVLALATTAIFSASTERALGDVGMGLGGVAYCSLTLGFLIAMPRELVLVLFAVVWTGDAAAYYGGRALGRHLLAPRVSPKKTIEGAAAGLIGSIAAGAAGGLWILGEPWLHFAAVSAAAALAGQLGDLAESALKRSAGVKDSSSILPGHGGILDRLDSLLFAAPVFYWFFIA